MYIIQAFNTNTYNSIRMATDRCFVCGTTTDSNAKRLYSVCKCRVAHEKCLMDFITDSRWNQYEQPKVGARWRCSTCGATLKLHLSHGSFWTSVCANNINGPHKLRAILFAYAAESIVGLLIQMILCAYIGKLLLWVVTHATTYQITEQLNFTIYPAFSDILLGITAYAIIVFPSIFFVYLFKRTYDHCTSSVT
jgi:hypothetical protein